MKDAFTRAYPSWDGKQMQPKESVEMVLKVVDDAGVEKSGQFVSHFVRAYSPSPCRKMHWC